MAQRREGRDEGPVEVAETALPGIGLRHDFEVDEGRRVGVISHRSGQRDLLLYAEDDPDTCEALIRLSPDEADTLAELLGAPRVTERIARIDEQVEGLVTEGVPIAPGSRFDGATLAATATRTRTGASIIAVSRAGTLLPMPGTDFVFAGGDTVVVVGTREGVDAATAILTGS